MVVAPEKLDVDGVGGARLESMVGKAAEWKKLALQVYLWRWQLSNHLSSSAVLGILCRKGQYISNVV